MRTLIVSGFAAILAAGPARAVEQSVSIERIAEAIEAHIAEKAEAQGGSLRLQHDGRTLSLKLVRVHMEYLSDLGGGVQFACVDLVGADGPVYDVDFFLSGGPGRMTVTETTVHKVNGQPLYAWKRTPEDTWVRVPVEGAPDHLLGVIRGTDAFEFTYRFRLPQIADSARIWLPLARSSAHQSIEVLAVSAPSSVREVKDVRHENPILFMTAGPQDGGKSVEIRYLVRRDETSPYPASGPFPHEHLEPELLVPRDSTFVEIARRVVQGKATDLMRARALYDHVLDEVRYARYGQGWGRGDAVYACNARSGNCTDFHAYFIALARAAHIPARFAIGAAIPSERDDGGIDGYHCWAEFFADGQWWPVDISEADKNSGLATYYFGHQPANRIELSRGRDLLVTPAPVSGPINFLAYPVLEVDGETVTMRPEFTFRRLKRGG